MGVPGAGSDVLIYSGGNDLVTLDVGSATINSLTLGGATNGFTYELTDGGVAQSLNIIDMMTVGQQGTLLLYGGGTVGVGNGALNRGFVDMDNGSTLTISGDADNFGSMTTNGSGLGGGNKLNITSALFNEAGATFALFGPGDKGTVGLGIVNAGLVQEEQGSTLGTGTLTNTPLGSMNVEGGSTLTVTSDARNDGTLVTNFFGLGGGNTISIGGMLTNYGTFQLNGPGDKASVGNGVLNNGNIDVNNGSTLTSTGDVDNFGSITTNGHGFGGGNTLTIIGALFNEANATYTLNGPGDAGSIALGIVNAGTVSVSQASILTTGTLKTLLLDPWTSKAAAPSR